LRARGARLRRNHFFLARKPTAPAGPTFSFAADVIEGKFAPRPLIWVKAVPTCRKYQCDINARGEEDVVSKERGNGGGATDRFAGLLSWWGIADPSKTGPYEAQLKRLQGFLSDLQGAYGEAYARQTEAYFAANEHFAHAVQDLMRCRGPGDVVEAESKLMSALMEEAATQAKAWTDLTQKLTECCTAATRDTFATARESGAAAARTAPSRATTGKAHEGKHLQPV
jgi:hypothetical protein